MILIAPSLSYSQYVKKIGGEEKIVISKAEGEKINASFDSLTTLVSYQNYRIDSLIKANIKTRDSLRIDLLTLRDTLTLRNKISLDTLNDYRNRYYKNIAIYDKHEKELNNDMKNNRYTTILFTIIVYFLFSQIH